VNQWNPRCQNHHHHHLHLLWRPACRNTAAATDNHRHGADFALRSHKPVTNTHAILDWVSKSSPNRQREIRLGEFGCYLGRKNEEPPLSEHGSGSHVAPLVTTHHHLHHHARGRRTEEGESERRSPPPSQVGHKRGGEPGDTTGVKGEQAKCSGGARNRRRRQILVEKTLIFGTSLFFLTHLCPDSDFDEEGNVIHLVESFP
jgi:hypothetical protein